MTVALYARVSTGRQAEMDLSIPDQIRQMNEWCKSQGMIVAKEYVEPGASATDDRRPVFQQMIADATLDPAPYEAIIVYSQSRFFRDALEFWTYERTLQRSGVKVISISQPVGDEPSGDMARKIFSVFDEYQSKENGKHTLRSMKENARQGYWNGSRPPFGYDAADTGETGNRGKRKKRLAIHEAEAETVRTIFDLYLNGREGGPMGMKQIATHLNGRGLLMRGHRWRIQKVQRVLSDTTYIGVGWFNRTDSKTMKAKPRDQWVPVKVPAIIDEAAWQAVAARREVRQLDKISRAETVPTLLGGLLKCGCCGSGMTLVTSKRNRYRYYRCTNRIAKSNTACTTANIPEGKLNARVMEAFRERVLAPNHMKAVIADLIRQQSKVRTGDDVKLATIGKALKAVEGQQDRLYEAVGKGMVPQDETLSRHFHRLQAERQELVIQYASINRRRELPLKDLTGPRVEAFARAVRTRLTEGQAFARSYLRLLVREIWVTGNQAVICGGGGALVAAISGGAGNRVLSSVPGWRPQGDSNPCYRRERAVS